MTALLAPTRLPYAPLCAFAPTRKALARRLDIDRHALVILERNGITLAAADRICDRLGVHPTEIWGDDWLTAVLADDLCGTETGYRRHVRWGEEPCADCRQARNVGQRSRRERARRERAA